MNSYLTRITIAVSSVVLVTGCGTGGSDVTASRVSQETPAVADGTYDGWAVRAAWDDLPAPCRYSPDQVERLLESGAPVPACIRRLQRWFEEQYGPAVRHHPGGGEPVPGQFSSSGRATR